MFFNSLQYFQITLALGGIVAILSGFLVYLNDKKSEQNMAWFLLTLASAIWSFGYFAMISFDDQKYALIANWILHGGAILIPVLYFRFIIALIDRERFFLPLFNVGLGIAVLILAINPTPYFVTNVFAKYIFPFAPNAGPLYIYFTIYFFAYVILALAILGAAILAERNTALKNKLRLVFYSSSAGFIGGGSVFFLTFNIFIPPYPLILFALYPTIIAYAIIKHRLFNVKVFVTELLTMLLWILLAVRLVLSQTAGERLLDTALLVSTIVLGLFLIKSVRKEVDTREKIEKLATQLEKSNKQLAGANLKLKELDKQKSEFVSIASHQLYTPLTAIKGYVSMLLEDSPSLGKIHEGTITAAGVEALDRVFKSANSLVLIIEDLLSISRIEQGRMVYNMQKADVNEILHDLVEMMIINAKERGLELSYSAEAGKNYCIDIDKEKMRQVFSNIIGNSLKYTPAGSVTVKLENDGKQILLTIKDTGMGISKETMGKLFGKFVRAENAKKSNVTGTGLGLYVAREIVTAHKGRIWAESAGADKGSTFFVELPSE